MSAKSNHNRGINRAKQEALKPKKVQLTSQSTEEISKWTAIPVELQQLLLDIFEYNFSASFKSNYSELVQQVKQHLYNRDFNNAFGTEDLRQAYAMRWSPSRALAYASIFYSLPLSRARVLSDSGASSENFGGNAFHQPQDVSGKSRGTHKDSHNSNEETCRVVCIGAGAGAEIVALGGYMNHLDRLALAAQSINSPNGEQHETSSSPRIATTAIDIADWSSVTRKLHSGTTTAPTLSPYASAKAKAANAPLIRPDTLTLEFLKQDVLNMATEQMLDNFANASLVTLMFTLNELYSTSMSKTTNLLLSLTMLLSPGALLLVVDSPGSYSTVGIGHASNSVNENKLKKYPMHWLLDHTLLESAAVGSSKNVSGDRQWEKIESRVSEWFRLSNQLRYPVDLEDMRYQLHLYRRL